jgi:hypothetical protein
LDLERSTEVVGNGLGERDVKSAVGLSTLMQRKGRQVLVETDFQRIFGRMRCRHRQ